MTSTPEPQESSLPEPAKWNLLAWVWWKLGEPMPGKPQPYFESTNVDLSVLATGLGDFAPF